MNTVTCWFCGNETTHQDNFNYGCTHCLVIYSAILLRDEMFLMDTWFCSPDYAIQLNISGFEDFKTALVKKDPNNKYLSKVLTLPYHIDINPSNIDYWIERLKTMVPFS